MELCSHDVITNIAEIVVDETQATAKSKIFSLNFHDQSDRWLVVGSPFDDIITGMRFNIFYMHVMKTNCEILDIGSQARFPLSPDEEAKIPKELTGDPFDAAYGKPASFGSSIPTIDFCQIFYGGIINSTQNAKKFAQAIIGAHSNASSMSSLLLEAELFDGVWHIHAGATAGGPVKREILIFNRRNAKILSFTP